MTLKLVDAFFESMMRIFSEVLPPQLTAFIISVMPILELKLGIVAARLLHLPLWQAFFVCVAGTMLPVPFILIFIEYIFKWMKRIGGPLAKIVLWLEKKAEKGSKRVQRLKTGGLIIFTVLGSWTAALVASFLKVRFRDAVVSIFIGVVLSATVMLAFSYSIF